MPLQSHRMCAQVFGEGAAIDPSADVAGQLLYDAILLDTSQHVNSGGEGQPHKPKFKKLSRKLLKRLRAFNTSATYNGLPVRPNSAQLAALEFLGLFSRLANFIHTRLRAVPGLETSPPNSPSSHLRGISCLFMASGQAPYEGAWEGPAATACMVLESEEPEELVAIGNVLCNSALAARAQITATLDRIAAGGPELDALLGTEIRKAAQRTSGGSGSGTDGDAAAAADDAEEAAMRASLEEGVVRLLHQFDVETFGQDGTPYEAGAQVPVPVAATSAEDEDQGEGAPASPSAPTAAEDSAGAAGADLDGSAQESSAEL